MKLLNVWFEDLDHKKFVEEKKKLNLNWHDFLLELLIFYQENKNK